MGLSSRDAMFFLRRAKRSGTAEADRKVAAHMKNLKERGFLFPVGDVSNEDRAELGLSPIPYKKIKSDMDSFVKHFDHVMKTFAVGWGAD